MTRTIHDMWRDHALEDALDWLKAKGVEATDAELEVYKAGFLCGWETSITTGLRKGANLRRRPLRK